MAQMFDIGDNPGPAMLGHDPLVLPEQRKKLVDKIDSTGVLSVRDDPALPWIKS